jgi:hypothetical protein
MAILVEALRSNTRALLLEFAIDPTKHGDMPQQQRFRVSEKRLIQCIRNATDAGWDPNSRGKRFIFDAGSLNPN